MTKKIYKNGVFYFLFNGIFLHLLLMPAGSICQTGPAGIGLNNGTNGLELWMNAEHTILGDTFLSQDIVGRVLRGIEDKSGANHQLKLPENIANTLIFINSKQANGLRRIGFNRNTLTPKPSGILIDSIFKSGDFTAYIVLEPQATRKKEKQTVLSFLDKPDTIGLLNSTIHNFSLEIIDNQFIWTGNFTGSKDAFNVSLPFVPAHPYIIRLSNLAANGLIEMSLNDGKIKNMITNKSLSNGLSLLSIGFNGLDNPYKGYMADLIIFSRYLNPIERIMIENSLSAQYNIPLTNNDIYANDASDQGEFDFDVAGIGKASDGSMLLDAKGTGIFEIRNPAHLNNNEYLIWGRNNLSLMELDSTDIPRGLSYRLKTSWRCSERGEIGPVDILVDTSDIKIPPTYKLVMLIDRNQSGQFVDDTLLIFQQGNLNKQRSLSQIQLNNGDRFTLGIFRDNGQITSGLMTPNGDGTDDTFYVQVRGMVRIMNQNGNLVRELRAPAPWDGKNNDGQLVSPGTYTLEINRQERINVSVRY